MWWIDANELWLSVIRKYDFVISLGELLNEMEKAPSVVRCKDCKFYRQEIDMCDEPYSTAHNVVHEDDFCSKAERRKGEGNL